MSDPRIIRKKTGNFLEDFEPGQILRHKGGKTITEGLFATFSDFSSEATTCAASPWSQTISNSSGDIHATA